MGTETDPTQIFENAIRDGIREGVKQRLSATYNSPFNKAIDELVIEKIGDIKGVISEAITQCVTDDEFRAEIGKAVRTQMARTLVQRFGGELERQVNALKSDPATRARIQLAIEEIVKERSAAVAV